MIPPSRADFIGAVRRATIRVMDAFAHCENLVREADKDRFLASLFAPAEKRRDLFALYAFNAEVAAVEGKVHDPMAGEIRLQYWHDLIAHSGDAGGNPVPGRLIAIDSSLKVAPRGMS